MLNALYKSNDIIIYLKSSYFIKNAIFFLYFFLIRILLNTTIISNLLYYLIIYNLFNVFLIKSETFRFRIIKTLKTR